MQSLRDENQQLRVAVDQRDGENRLLRERLDTARDRVETLIAPHAGRYLSVAMEQVNVSILDRDYRLSCEPSEREQLLAAVAHVDATMKAIRDQGRSPVPIASRCSRRSTSRATCSSRARAFADGVDDAASRRLPTRKYSVECVRSMRCSTRRSSIRSGCSDRADRRTRRRRSGDARGGATGSCRPRSRPDVSSQGRSIRGTNDGAADRMDRFVSPCRVCFRPDRPVPTCVASVVEHHGAVEIIPRRMNLKRH